MSRAEVSAEGSVAESEAAHRALLAALPDGVLLTDADGTVLSANPVARELLGVDEDFRPLPAVPPVPAQRGAAPTPPRGVGRVGGAGRSTLDELTAPARAALAAGSTQRRVVLPRTSPAGGGARRWVSVTAVPLLGDDGLPQAVVSSLSDVTEEHEAALAAGRGDDMFRLAMQHSPIGFALAGLTGRFLRVNRRFCRMLGYRADELQQRTVYEVVHPEELEDTSVRIGELLRGDVASVELRRRFLGHGGMVLWGTLSVTLVKDESGRPLHFVVQAEDVSEVHKAHDLVTHMTLHDPLTGMPNRALLVERMQQALDRSRRGDRRVAVLHADLDHFRVINSHSGHDLGDALLVEVGRRIGRAMRSGDVAGRVGGDEFVVVCEDVVDERQAIAVAERIQAAVSQPVTVGDRTVVPTASIGIALSGSPRVDPLTLLRDADIATARAKEQGRNRWDVVDGGLRRRAIEWLDIEHSLRGGLAAGDLRLHFQPIVDVRSRQVVGREALLRWQHPERGLLAPGEFLHVAEESGLISEIGRWVLDEAVRAAAASPDLDGYVAINVSPNQVARPGLAETVGKALGDAGLPPERLVVELTESVMLSAAPSARRELTALDELGVRIVVDDFGTGFSALSYLRDLPVSGIKVDRSFTAGVGQDTQSERIVEALTGLGRGLGVDVIVEGVETEQQHDLLAGLGARHAQGYLFGRPAPGYDG